MSPGGDRLAMATTALTTAPAQFGVTGIVNAPQDAVSDFVSDHQQLPARVPRVKSVDVDNTRVDQPREVGAVRIMHAGL